MKKMILNLLKKHLAILIIFLVSGLAFTAGYIQNDYGSKAEKARDDANDYQFNAVRMEEKLRSIMNSDGDRTLEAISKKYDITYHALEYLAVNSTLTETEREVYRLKFAKIVGERNLLIVGTTAYIIHEEFTLDSSLEEYPLATIENDGFDYKITREEWERYTPAYLTLKDTFYAEIGLSISPGLVEDLEYYTFYEEAGGNEYFIILDWGNIGNLLRGPYHAEIEKQLDKEVEADSYETLANKITIGVSITTIATILATAMGNRISDNESNRILSEIRADINNDPSYSRGKRDFSSYLGLILSLIIATLGLILPVAMMIYNL